MIARAGASDLTDRAEFSLRSFLRSVGSFLRKASIKVLSGRFQSSLIITVLTSATETAVRPFDNAKACRLDVLNSRCLLPQKFASNPSFDDYKTRLPIRRPVELAAMLREKVDSGR